MSLKILKQEYMNKNEPMFITWGRIYALCGLSKLGTPKFNKKKLQKLIEKFDQDLMNAKIEEDYFKPQAVDTNSLSEQELRDEHVYGEVLEQELMEAQDEQNII